MTIINLGTRIVNNYLFSSEAGWILIDTGYAGGFPHFLKMLEKNHIQLKEIRYVFLTHAHDDHAGFLNEVLTETDAEVICHPKAIDGLKRGQNSFEGGCSSRLEWLFCQVLALFGHGGHRYPAIKDEFLNRLTPIDSKRFKTLDFPYEVLETPGHTSDHVALLAGDALFCGDAAMNGFPSRRHTTIWIENLEQYKRSWEDILHADPVKLYPSHGKPFLTADLKQFLPSLDRVRLFPLKGSRKKGSEAHR